MEVFDPRGEAERGNCVCVFVCVRVCVCMRVCSRAAENVSVLHLCWPVEDRKDK